MLHKNSGLFHLLHGRLYLAILRASNLVPGKGREDIPAFEREGWRTKAGFLPFILLYCVTPIAQRSTLMRGACFTPGWWDHVLAERMKSHKRCGAELMLCKDANSLCCYTHVDAGGNYPKQGGNTRDGVASLWSTYYLSVLLGLDSDVSLYPWSTKSQDILTRKHR